MGETFSGMPSVGQIRNDTSNSSTGRNEDDRGHRFTSGAGPWIINLRFEIGAFSTRAEAAWGLLIDLARLRRSQLDAEGTFALDFARAHNKAARVLFREMFTFGLLCGTTLPA